MKKIKEFIFEDKSFKKRLIKISSISLCAILVTSLFIGGIISIISVFSTTAEAFNGDVIRLHVIANSDESKDQELKIKVRDAVLSSTGADITSAEATSDARIAIEKDLKKIEDAANACIKQQGFDYPVKVEWGVFPFPARTYGNVTLPAGDYRAVRVIIGEGKGQNWWCVMFPPLCFVDETKATMPQGSLDKLSANTRELLSLYSNEPTFKIKFKLFEMFGIEKTTLVFN